MPELRTFNKSIGSVIVVDTGLIVEYLTGSEKGLKIKEMIFANDFIVSVLVTPLTIIELYYIVRRKNSLERTLNIINNVKNLVKIIPIDDIVDLIGEIKAFTAFSLTDSANIALSEKKNIKILFKHEQEIDNHLKKSKDSIHATRILFVDDFPYFQP